MEKRKRQTTTEKILSTVFDLLESSDNLLSTLPTTWRIYDKLYGRAEYKDIMRRISWQKSRMQFAKFINNLKRRGYLKIKIEKDKSAVILTPNGLEKILRLSLEKSDRKKRRDGKWQMIIWDIPENYKKTREKFRNALKSLGYQQLQKSVWVCPYNIIKETEKVIRFYGTEEYVRLFLISEIAI